jgi:chromosomal replication initiator protein
LVTRPSYETWLRGTVGLRYVDGEFVVGTPNVFVAEMLDRRMYPLISQVMERVVDDGVEVRFQVMPLAPPESKAADVSRSAPEMVQDATATAPASGRTNGQPGGPDTDYDPSRSLPLLADRGTSMNSRYTFQSFIVGKSNELAHAAAQAVSENPGLTYNPLFIYSGVGLGKTHLLHAIGHRIISSGLSLIYATTEEFTNEYIKAIRDGKTEEFRGRYRSADVLLLDDIQFIIGKEQTQEGFFHTFNALHMASRQIVITSDRPATALTLLEDRVSSRLAGGLVVDIQPPDLETRQAILRAKAEVTGQLFPKEVLQFLAERAHANIRELEGCLTRLAAYANLVAGPITLDLVKEAIQDILRPTASRPVSDTAVLNAVCAYFAIDKDTLTGRRRDKQTVLARQVAMYLLREEANLSLTTIGRFLGDKDHTTVLYACRRITDRLHTDTHLHQDIINIRTALTPS